MAEDGRCRHPLLVRLLPVLLSTVLGLAGAEAVVRLSGTAPEVSPVRRGRFQLSDNPRLVFEPVPGMTVPHREEGGVELFYEYPGTANRLGYRDRNHPVDKPPGTTRIVVLGDSIAAGWGIDETGNAFPALVEAALQEDGGGDPEAEREMEVLNFAVTGYNTAQEVETLASRALPYDPDLVLLAYCLNDRRPPDPRLVEALREVAVEPGAVAPWEMDLGLRRLLFESALYRLLRFRLLDPGSDAVRRAEGAAEAGAAGTGPVDPAEPGDGGPAGAEGVAGAPAGDGGTAEGAGAPAGDGGFGGGADGNGGDFGDDPEAALEATPHFGPDGEPMSGPAGVEHALDRLARLAAEEGFRVLVVVFPHQRNPYRHWEHHQHVRDLASDHGFAVLDLTEAFQECKEATDRPIAFDRYHPTEIGHRCAAQAIVERLRGSRLLVPGDDP